MLTAQGPHRQRTQLSEDDSHVASSRDARTLAKTARTFVTVLCQEKPKPWHPEHPLPHGDPGGQKVQMPIGVVDPGGWTPVWLSHMPWAQPHVPESPGGETPRVSQYCVFWSSPMGNSSLQT